MESELNCTLSERLGQANNWPVKFFWLYERKQIHMAWKKLVFQLVLWASSSYILLAWGQILFIFVNDFIRNLLVAAPSPAQRKNGEFSFVRGRVRQHVGYFIRRWLAWSLAHWVSKLQKLLSQQENLLVPDYRTRHFSSAEFRERMCMFNFCVNALPFIQCSYFIYAPQASLSLRPCDKKTRYSGNPRLEAAYWFLSTIE